MAVKNIVSAISPVKNIGRLNFLAIDASFEDGLSWMRAIAEKKGVGPPLYPSWHEVILNRK